MIEILAVLSVSAAAGMRIALPLLMIGLLRGEGLWSEVPILSAIHPSVVLGTLVSWSLLELFASKKRLGHRVLQLVELSISPIAGAILGVAVTKTTALPDGLIGVVAVVGGLLALVLQLVQVGWFFRLQGLPLPVIFAQDILCISLVFLAFDAPRQGGLIALTLLWLAIRSSKTWRRWYLQQASPAHRRHPRRYKRSPD